MLVQDIGDPCPGILEVRGARLRGCREPVWSSPLSSLRPHPGRGRPGLRLSEGWVSEVVARYEAEGEAAFEPRSRKPRTSPNPTAPQPMELIVQLRTELTAQGLDAGPDTIRWHLAHHQLEVSRTTISCHLKKAGLAGPTPQKRPKTSYRGFAATMPNETWQADFIHDQLSARLPARTVGLRRRGA